MNLVLRVLLGCLGILFIGSACSLVSSPQPGSVLFQDDFEADPSGWSLINDSSGSIRTDRGILYLSIRQAGSSIITTPGLDLQNVSIEVQARKFSGLDDNSFGLICRYQDADNFYFYQISSDGYYGLGKVKNGLSTLFGNPLMQPHPAVLLGDQVNELRFDCRDNQMSAYTNGELIAVFEDSSFNSGDVGVIAGTIGSPEVEIGFDLFTVKQP